MRVPGTKLKKKWLSDLLFFYIKFFIFTSSFPSSPHLHPQASSSSSTLSNFILKLLLPLHLLLLNYILPLNIQRQKTTMASAGVLRACSFCSTLTVTSLPNSSVKVFIFSLSFPTNSMVRKIGRVRYDSTDSSPP